jgi:hypothetical protein
MALGCGGDANTDQSATAPSGVPDSAQFQRCLVIANIYSYNTGATVERLSEPNNLRICGTADNPTALGQDVPEDRLKAECDAAKSKAREDVDFSDQAIELLQYLDRVGVCP